MKIAAFDLGTTWARASNNHQVVPTYSNTLGGKKAKRPEKLGIFTDALQITFASAYDVVVYERPFARGQAATRFLWAMAGILEAAAHNAGCAILDWTPAEIKKWATGDAKADKSAMLAAARRLGYRGENEHEADAFCLLRMAEAQLTKEKA